MQADYKFTKFDYAMMRTAEIWADLSHSKRKKVGCVIAKDNRIVTHGYNGLPHFLGNDCEKEGKTKAEVMHAEHNALLFAAKHGIPLNKCTVYITCIPCKTCASMLSVAGIDKIVYNEFYESGSNGTDLSIFERAGIELIQLKYDLTDPIWTS